MSAKRSADATPSVPRETSGVDKSVGKSGGVDNLRPFVKGADKRRGKGPAKGSPKAGRPPNWWREKMAELRDRWLATAEADKIVENSDHPEWRRLGQALHEMVEGKPAQAINAKVDATVTVRFTDE